MDEIQKLKDRLVELHASSTAIQNKADLEKRDLTVDERKEIDALAAEFDDVESDVKRRERIAIQSAALAKPGQRVTQPEPLPQAATTQQPSNGLQNTRLRTQEERQRWGFNTAGEFYKSVKNAAVSPQNIDPRLIQNAALSTYGSEGSAADGGFAVPPEWRGEIMKQVMGEDSLLGRCDQQPVSGNTITYPVDETTAWQTSGGILSYWDAEAATITQSKPSLRDLTIKLHRLTALVPVTEELLDDAPAMTNYVTSKAGEKMAFKVNDAIVNGTGAGQPLGILNAACTVSVSKESSQSNDTFFGVNAVKMMARMPAASFSRSVWLVNQDVVPFILQLGFVVKNPDSTAAGAGALYLPPNGLANSGPYGSMLGRPIVVTEACPTVGDVGDVILADLTKYLAVVKGALRSDVSIHLWFDQNTTAFRFVLRMNGQPWLSAAIARKSGSNTLSHFVTLAAR
jgi:HK97 family phage major capsid protein